eukprot:scaffold305_cov247-Pinguiococcus_pyrenoidosus.AAC.26
MQFARLPCFGASWKSEHVRGPSENARLTPRIFRRPLHAVEDSAEGLRPAGAVALRGVPRRAALGHQRGSADGCGGRFLLRRLRGQRRGGDHRSAGHSARLGCRQAVQRVGGGAARGRGGRPQRGRVEPGTDSQCAESAGRLDGAPGAVSLGALAGVCRHESRDLGAAGLAGDQAPGRAAELGGVRGRKRAGAAWGGRAEAGFASLRAADGPAVPFQFSETGM